MSAMPIRIPLALCVAILPLGLASGCKSLPDDVRGRINEANTNYEAGNVAAALEAYKGAIGSLREFGDEARPEIEVRIGKCQVELGQASEAIATFDTIDRDVEEGAYQLTENLEYDKFLGHAEAYCELGRRAEPAFLSGSGSRSKQIQEQRTAAGELFSKARALFERARKLRANDFEAQLGIAYSFLRYGILIESESALAQARDTLRKCPRPPQADDPRLPFYNGRVTQVLQSKGVLTNDVLSDMTAAAEIDARQRSHGYHEMYRDLFLQVQAYDNERKVELLEESKRQRVKEVLAILNNYLQYGQEPRASWPQWVDFRGRLRGYFDNYNAWSRKKRERDELIQSAKSLVYGTSETQEVLRFRQAMDLLRKVDTEFLTEKDYSDVRTVAQQQYIKLLIASAEALGRIEKWDLALKQIDEARELCVQQQFAPEHAALLEQCTKASGKYKAGKEWAALQEKVRARARVDQNAALAMLETELKPELRSQLDPAEIGKFHDQILDIDRRQVETLLAEAREIDPTPRMEKLQQARQLVTERKLDDLRDEVVRQIQRCYIALGQHQQSIDSFNAIGAPTDDDKLHTALAYSKKDEHPQAYKIFRAVDDTIIRTSKPEIVRAAGVSALRAGKPSEARPFLEEALSHAQKTQVDVAGTKDGLLTCYRQILESGGLEPREEIEIRAEIAKQEEDDTSNLRKLAVLHYDAAKTSNDANAGGFELAYKLFKEVFVERAIPLTDDEKKLYCRLAARFEDYVPLKKSVRWEYNVINGPATTYEVTDGSGELFNVDLQIAGEPSPFKQEWQKLPTSRVLEIRYTGSRDRLPIGLVNPEEKVGERAVVDDFGKGKRRYEARVVEIGLSIETGGRTYENCIKVEVREQGRAEHRDFYFAPGVGQIKYTDSQGTVWELQRSTVLDAT
ncbi:MAG: hypothetical protein L0Z55_01495 [Planctomycetes bacterium]|nr:hypothetical protein [Planctomycetota bacterium]